MNAYLDNNSRTMTDPQVLELATPFFTDSYANPKAMHSHAKDVRVPYRLAMEKIYASIHARPNDHIAITSGGDESNTRLFTNIYLNDILTGQKNHIIISERESSAIMKVIEHISAQGGRITVLPINNNGVIDTELLKNIITPKTALVSISMVDRETGAIMPIDEITEACKENDVPLHIDATHAVGKAHIDVQMLDVDYLTLSAETIHSLPGIGILYIKEDKETTGLLSDSKNTAGIIALGKALEQAIDAEAFEMEDARELRDRLEESINSIDDSIIIVPWAYRAPHCIMAGFKDVDSQMLLWELDKYGISAYTEDGRTLVESMGIDGIYKHTLVGFALSRYTTSDEIDYTIDKLKKSIKKIRANIAYTIKEEI